MFKPILPRRSALSYRLLLALVAGSAVTVSLPAQGQQAPTTDPVKAIREGIGGLRAVPDEKRGEVTRQLAVEIRALPDPALRLSLAASLANLSTEGDFGQATLQEVATTLAEALRSAPAGADPARLGGVYLTLAQLIRYENVSVKQPSPELTAALATLEAEDKKRERADFTLADLTGKAWTLKALKGKVVVVNFWATWCPPCRKEIPDLEALYQRFKGQGLVVLGISDETVDKVAPFVKKQAMSYPVLLDPDRKVNTLFGVAGIPRTLIYDRQGKLAAQAIDMRTQKQFLALLARAGVK